MCASISAGRRVAGNGRKLLRRNARGRSGKAPQGPLRSQPRVACRRRAADSRAVHGRLAGAHVEVEGQAPELRELLYNQSPPYQTRARQAAASETGSRGIIQRLLDEKAKAGLSAQSVTNIRTVLRSSLAQAVKTGSGSSQQRRTGDGATHLSQTDCAARPRERLAQLSRRGRSLAFRRALHRRVDARTKTWRGARAAVVRRGSRWPSAPASIRPSSV